MNIFNHIIKDSEIIGIGPLMMRGSNSKEQNDLYNPKQQFFLIHCRGYSIEIVSDWYELGGGNHITDHNKKERIAFDQYRSAYIGVRDAVAEIINAETLTLPARNRKSKSNQIPA